MSDHWVCIIPTDPEFIPSSGAIAKAEALMTEIATAVEEISSSVSKNPLFRDCGGNFMSVHCPVCDATIDTDWWKEQMGDEDYWDTRVELKPLDLPCGHRAPSLNDLRYDWDQGFSRFVLEAPNVAGLLEPEQVSSFEAVLGCTVKVIYQHI